MLFSPFDDGAEYSNSEKKGEKAGIRECWRSCVGGLVGWMREVAGVRWDGDGRLGVGIGSKKSYFLLMLVKLI